MMISAAGKAGEGSPHCYVHVAVSILGPVKVILTKWSSTAPRALGQSWLCPEPQWTSSQTLLPPNGSPWHHLGF